jgi:serine/threonine protein kinase
MPSPNLEDHLLQLAAQAGWVDPAQWEGPLPEDLPTAIWGARVQSLVLAGALSRTWVEAEAARYLGGREETETSPEPMAEARELSAYFPFEVPYTKLELVAVGGAGRVFKAWDHRLHRSVALKFLRMDRHHRPEDLLAEARAQAQVSHPNVCPVLEVGLLGGSAYFAMPWMEEGSLSSVMRHLTLPEKIRIMAQVCDGVHAAHLHGLLHLDIKPANILMERHAHGSWGARVSDFGLVVTTEGSLRELRGTGTPPFACPELSMKDLARLDARSDVYSLGVTFLVVLTQRFPHESDSAQGPRVPSDLMRIARKAMSPWPEDRYASPRAMGEDLRRYLNHEPLEASPPTPLHRARLWIRRHRPMAVALLILGLSATFFGAWAWRTRLLAQRQARAAQAFGQESKACEDLMSLANLSPQDSQYGLYAQIRSRMDALQKAMAEMGPEGIAPGYLALGKMRLRMDDLEAAEDCLQRAWNAGAREGEPAELLGQLKGIRALRAELGSGEGWSTEGAHPELKAEALALMGASSTPGPTRVLQAELQGDPRSAIRIGHEALETSQLEPWRYEGWLLLLEIWEMRSAYLIEAGHQHEVSSQLDLFEATLSKALQVGRNDPALHAKSGQLGLARAYLAESQHRDPTGELRRALSGFTLASRIDPQESRYIRWRADTLRRLAAAAIARHQDPLPQWQEAEAALRPWVDSARPRHACLITYGRVLAERATFLRRQGQDHRADRMRALEIFDRCLRLTPEDHTPLALMAELHLNEARALRKEGGDPTRELAAGLENMGQLPEHATDSIWTELVDLRAENAMRHGLDPLPELAACISQLQALVALTPQSGARRFNLARLLARKAEASRHPSDLGAAREALAHLRHLAGSHPGLQELEHQLGALKQAGRAPGP